MKIVECKVELIDSMGTDISVVNAARVSFHKKSYIYYDDDDPSVEYICEEDKKLINYLAKHNHWSPFAHTCLSFRIKAPIFVARQLAKHQIGLSWNEVSRRYVDEEPEFYFPKEWRGKPITSKQGSNGKFDPNQIDYNLDMWSRTLCLNSLDLYQKCVKDGLCPEQARMILPQNMMTEWIWTGNVASFGRVCKLRLDPHTQKETQDVVKLIYDLILPRFPNSIEAFIKY